MRRWLLVLFCFGPLAPSVAHAASEEGTEQAIASRTSGVRFQMGALAFAHARRVDTGFGDKEPGTVAPGGSLGVAWRVEGWELGPTFRLAYFQEPNYGSTRRTGMTSLGGRARWFAFPASGVSPFIDAGVDFLVFFADETHGIGPSAHVGAGIEIFHADAHHRLRFDLGVDVPTFALAYPEVSPNCAGCGRSSASKTIYLVPGTVAATWTF